MFAELVAAQTGHASAQLDTITTRRLRPAKSKRTLHRLRRRPRQSLPLLLRPQQVRLRHHPSLPSLSRSYLLQVSFPMILLSA